MAQLFESIFLTDLIILIALVTIFIWLSRQALATREYTGYGLGWLISLFFVVIYSSVTGDAIAPTQEVAARVTLSFLQVAVPTVCGVGVGVTLLLLIGLARSFPRRYTLLVSIVTSLNLILLFLMFVVNLETRRMLGIFSLAFIISAIVTTVLFGRGSSQQTAGYAQALGAPDPNAPTMTPGNPLEQMRQRFRR
jgi:hypothetical protein